MDPNSETNLGESSQSSTIDGSATCSICHTILSSDNDAGNIDAISVCSNCFSLLEDLEATSLNVHQILEVLKSRVLGESIENLEVPEPLVLEGESIESKHSQNLSQLINLARQNQSTGFEHDYQSVDGDGAARLMQGTSSRTTPSGFRRWRRVLSLYGGETESNVSFRGYRAFHGEADTISYSVYGGDSDASVDGQSFMENENIGHPNGESDLESDTDIDPMNAGLYQWNSDDDDSEWEEADNERNTVESSDDDDSVWEEAGNERNTVESSDDDDSEWEEAGNERNTVESGESRDYLDGRGLVNLLALLDGRGLENLLEVLDDRGLDNLFLNLLELVDDRGLEDLFLYMLELETDSSRTGTPPASVSFINNNMPSITINEDKQLDNMACAVCKDSFTVGTVVNQLPCFHLFHPCCILPWLSTRNTCPLCRHELPSDDKDYESRKRNERNHIHPHNVNSDGSSGVINDDTVVDEISQLHHDTELSEQANADSVRNGTRNRWFYLAAPIVSILGISLVLCFGNPSQDRRCPSARIPHRRENNSQRRWWSFS